MSNLEQHEIQVNIAQIIERSRHHEEMFLTDSKTAASEILQFLHKKNLIAGFYKENLMTSEN